MVGAKALGHIREVFILLFRNSLLAQQSVSSAAVSWEAQEGCSSELTAESLRKLELFPGEGSVWGNHWPRFTG